MIHEKGDDFTPEAANPSGVNVVTIHPTAEDAVEQLWASIFLSSERHPPKSVVITGAESGEGATHVAVSLALTGSSTEHGLKIALVDCNLRHPAIAELFGIPLTPGFVDLIADGMTINSVLVQSDNPRLSIMPAGQTEDTLTSLLRSSKVIELIRQLEQDFDHVIIDAPAVNKYATTQALVGQVSGVVLVTKAGVTRREAVGEAKKRIELAQGKVLGVVLNQREFPIPGFLYDRL